MQKQWVIPPDGNATFVAAMEDVLEVYYRPHDPARPVVCLDEAIISAVTATQWRLTSKKLRSFTR